MDKKLTLQMDEAAIDIAKQYAAESGTSVSKLTSNFFHLLGAKNQDHSELPPISASLVGIIPQDIDEEDYKSHLEKKHR